MRHHVRGRWRHQKKKEKTPAIVRAHFRRRARERYGLELTNSDIEVLEQQIRIGRADYVWTESLSRVHFVVHHHTTPILAVYDRRRKALVTALPMPGGIGGAMTQQCELPPAKAGRF